MIVIAATILYLVGFLAILQGVGSLLQGTAFLRFVRRELAAPPPAYAPPAAILLPCKGLDPRLVETLERVGRQNYAAAYEVICAVESEQDGALPAIRAAAARAPVPIRCVVAQPSQECSQKIVNLLAALEQLSPATQVLAFLDSDAVPHENWLASIVAPLENPHVGAVTGYRWYDPAGGWVSLTRCVWNAMTLTLLGDHHHNFVWGGSVGIRRETFESLDIPTRWRRVLSEDYEVTRTVRAAGLEIRFAPRCVLPNHDVATWSQFWTFARRQLIITRVCHRTVWTMGAIMNLVFNTAFWGLLGLAAAAMAWGARGLGYAALAGWTGIYALAVAKSAVRQAAVALLVEPRHRSKASYWGDLLAPPLIGLLNFALMIASGLSNRFWWRGVHYEMQAIDRVTVLERAPASASCEAAGANSRRQATG